MTSLAFIFGVFPLAINTGAGAAAQNAIGTGVIGGMLSATLIAVFYIPLFFVLITRLFNGKVRQKPDPQSSDTLSKGNKS
jgi:multidrug efflux pump subunit AcrB